MSKFDELFKNIIAEMNIDLVKESNKVKYKPDTMLNQDLLNKKKINNERKPKVTVKSDGNTSHVTYTVDSDSSAEYMTDNIKANGGDASFRKSSGITKESIQVIPANGEQIAQQFENMPFDKEKYNQFLAEGKSLGIDAVSQYLQDHSAEVSDDFDFSEAPEEEYFVEYALVRYNSEQEIPEI